MEKRNPFVVNNVIPDFITLAELKYILINLIRERVSIKDIDYIFEKINDFSILDKLVQINENWDVCSSILKDKVL